MGTSTVSHKGWVVIPEELRRRYGIKKGDKVHLVDYGGVISIVPASQTPVKSAKGMSKGGTSLVKALAQTRQEDADRGK
jgi:AbrB family looped-hinge helix DNA binding protein